MFGDNESADWGMAPWILWTWKPKGMHPAPGVMLTPAAELPVPKENGQTRGI